MVDRTFQRLLASRILVALVVCATGIDPASSLRPNRQESGNYCSAVEALSLRGASALRGSLAARSEWIHAYEARERTADITTRHTSVALPRYTGAGETAIHKAIREAERLMEAGQDVDAFSLLIELTRDLKQARETHQVDRLMEKWNAHFPSELPVDVLESDLPGFITAAYDVYRRLKAPREGDENPEASARQAAEDEAFLRRLRQDMGSTIRDAAGEAGYESALDMLVDFIQAGEMGTEFIVHIAPALKERLGGESPISVVVMGMPSAAEIIRALKVHYVALREMDWSLLIDGQRAESVAGIILPGQRLKIVPLEPRSGSGGGGSIGGPKFRLESWLMFSLSLPRLSLAGLVHTIFERVMQLGRENFLTGTDALYQAA